MTISITNDTMVSIHYVLRDEQGDQLDASEAKEPLAYLHGYGQIVPGLEQALDGKAAGDNVEITVAPEGGYGSHDPEKVITTPREQFGFDINPGAIVRAESPDGDHHFFMILEVGEDTVTLDGNHPLAGKTLQFEVKVEAVRTATAEEISQAKKIFEGQGIH